MLTRFCVPSFELIIWEMRHSKQFIPFEEDNAKNNTVIDTVEDNSSPHLRRDDMLISGVRHSLQELIDRRLGSQG